MVGVYPKSTLEEMMILRTTAETLRKSLAKYPDHPNKMPIRKALDTWLSDVRAVGIENIKFFETIPYQERLSAIQGMIQHLNPPTVG